MRECVCVSVYVCARACVCGGGGGGDCLLRLLWLFFCVFLSFSIFLISAVKKQTEPKNFFILNNKNYAGHSCGTPG